MTSLTIHSLLAIIQGLSPSVPIVVRGAGSAEEFPVHVDILGLNDPESHVRVVLTSEGVLGSSSQSKGFALPLELMGLTESSGNILDAGGAIVGTAPSTEAEGVLNDSYLLGLLNKAEAEATPAPDEDDEVGELDTSDAESLGGEEPEGASEEPSEALESSGGPGTEPSSEPASDEWADLDNNKEA